jgi:hypothetical protein
MDKKEMWSRCFGTTVIMDGDRIKLCRVYGRWVCDCSDCAFGVARLTKED